MKTLILVIGLLISNHILAATESTQLRGKVVSFDLKTVTIEIAGKNHVFDREKLGKQFKGLKKGIKDAKVHIFGQGKNDNGWKGRNRKYYCIK